MHYTSTTQTAAHLRSVPWQFDTTRSTSKSLAPVRAHSSVPWKCPSRITRDWILREIGFPTGTSKSQTGHTPPAPKPRWFACASSATRCVPCG